MCLYAAGIFLLSSFPLFHMVARSGIDKLAHGVGYALLSFLLSLALRDSFPGKSRTLIAALAVLISVLYGVSDEIHQAFVPLREADPYDVLADAVGAMSMQLILFSRQGRSS